MKEKLIKIGRNLKKELAFYRNIIKNNRTPRVSKILISISIFYFLLPFDLIPDFIPVIGHMDDLIIIPLLIYLALKLVPFEVIQEARLKSELTDSDMSECG